MNARIVKARLLFLPYVVICVSFIVAYTFLHWLLIIKLHLIETSETTLTVILPVALSWIPILIWMWPRIKLLDFKDPDRTRFVYPLMAALLLSICTSFMQSYMISAAGTLTHLKKIELIYSQPSTRFYSFDTYFPKKQHARFHYSFNTSGKYNHRLNFHCYIVVPVYDNEPGIIRNIDTAVTLIRPVDYIELYADEVVVRSAPKAWVGIHFSDDISNRDNNDKKQRKFEEFRRSSINQFNNLILRKSQYFERVPNGNEKKNFIAAIESVIGFQKLSRPYNIFLPREGKFSARTNDTLSRFAYTFIGALSLWLLLISLPRLSNNRTEDFMAGKNRSFVFDKDFLEWVLPKRNYLVTPVLLYANLLLFLLMWFATGDFNSFNTHDLREWGASYEPEIKSGQWWRLLTSIFLHDGIRHLVLNMISLIIAGIVLERAAGTVRFLMVFVVSGIAGNIVSMYWHDNEVTVGASGAIFGLYGMFISFALSKVFGEKASMLMVYGGLCYIGINLLIGLIPGIDNAAHIGGLVCGFLLGFWVPGSARK